MKNFMNSVSINRNKKNRFDLTHDVKGTMKFGYLYPTLVMECLPGETFKLGCNMLTRFAPMVYPTMHRFKQSHQYFFVPNRIIWKNWEKFIGNINNAGSSLHSSPYFNVLDSGTDGGSVAAPYTALMDHMGIPTPTNTGQPNLVIDALPFYAYQKIWDDYYRQDFIIPSIFQSQTSAAPLVDGALDGDNGTNPGRVAALTALRKRAWEHDYFTSCLPQPQAGFAVELPIGDMVVNRDIDPATAGSSFTTVATTDPSPDISIQNILSENPAIESTGQLYAEGTNGNTTIEDLRQASAIQRLLERLMRTGRRYKELILAAFGTDVGDARLDRPELIFSVNTPIVISEVQNTTGTEELPQGNLAGHGIGVTNGKYSTYTTKEHGWIICVSSVLPMTAYQQGLPPSLDHKDSYLDYFWSEMAHLGEEAVPLRNLYAWTASPNSTFGYLPRFSRYRTLPNRVVGQFRDSKNSFHFGRIFSSAPALNQAFIECTTDKRIFAVTDENIDELDFMMVHEIMAFRPVPKFGTPKLD